MADYESNRRGGTDDGAGPQEEGDRVKTKPVSCSTVGEGTAVKRTSQHLTPEDEDESSADPPAPRKLSKIGFSMSSPMGKKSNPISIKLGASKPKEPVPSAPPKKSGMASVFDEDDTPTSAGPNSFNKGKQGFSDHQKLWERKMKAQADK
ncbi:hypothetical protein FQN60_011148, partial [Etheostoma spectabile]